MAEDSTHRTCGHRACPTTHAKGGALHQAFAFAPSAGLLLGAVVGAWVLRAYGRRAALMMANASLIAAFVVAAAKEDYYVLLVGSLVSDFGIGAVHVAVLVVDAELAPPARRLAFVTAAASLALGLGWSSASALALAHSALRPAQRAWFWRFVVLYGAWPCVLLLVIIPFVPESPLLLVQRGRAADALRALKDLRGPFADVKGEFLGIIHACAEAEGQDAALRRVRPRLFEGGARLGGMLSVPWETLCTSWRRAGSIQLSFTTPIQKTGVLRLHAAAAAPLSVAPPPALALRRAPRWLAGRRQREGH
jgi:MFS family permease